MQSPIKVIDASIVSYYQPQWKSSDQSNKKTMILQTEDISNKHFHRIKEGMKYWKDIREDNDNKRYFNKILPVGIENQKLI